MTIPANFCRITLALIVGCMCGSAGAAPAARPPEINRSYEFKNGGSAITGAEINADFSRLERLFGAEGLDALPASGVAAEEKGWLGVAMKLPSPPPKEPGTERILPAIEVAGVMPGSGAQSAGLLEGDLIAGFDDQPIETPEDKRMLAFRLAISKKHPGEKIALRILRGNTWLAPVATVQPTPKVTPALKPHPELQPKRAQDKPSLLAEALQKEQLTDEFARLLKGLRDETDKVVSPMVRHGDSYNPFRLQEVNYVMYHPLALPRVARGITDQLQNSFNKTHHDLAGLVQTAAGELDMAYAANAVPLKKPADFTAYVERLVNAIGHANAERAAVLSVLDAEEIDFLYQAVPEMLKQDPDAPAREYTAAQKKADEAKLLRGLQLVLKLDLPRLLNASAEIAQAIDLDTLAGLDKKGGKLEHYPPGWKVREEDNLTVLDTPAGRVLIGGPQDNVYTEDAALILDFGGNDKYFNHAGGSTRAMPFAVVIDLAGDDLYSAADDFAQGAGLLGGGFLIDLAGDDRYEAKNYSQGAGVLGVGILADLAGRDHYSAVTTAQGAAIFGVGLLAEGGGDDYYFGNRYVQGFGYIKGFGAIVEVAGNDNYFAGGMYEDFRAPGKSYQSMAQGFGLGMRPWESFVGTSGGIGVLLDAEGNDSYVADYFAQGASYWYSLGILDDRKGNDRYLSGRYSQGAGIHMSAGVLLDGEGDDSYLADFGVAQGCGHDFGIGFLLDNGGNDRYISGVIAQGAGNDNGIGILSDNGGNNEYYVKSLGQGRGNFEPVRDLGSFGLLFETGGGTNTYSGGGKSGSINYKTRWGILLDTN
jgi:hypothetical protein